jgi:hypothetical protein
MNDNINIDIEIEGSMNDNINMDTQIEGSMNDNIHMDPCVCRHSLALLFQCPC